MLCNFREYFPKNIIMFSSYTTREQLRVVKVDDC